MSNVIAMNKPPSPAPARTKMAVDGATKYYQTATGPVHALDDVSHRGARGRVPLHPRPVRLRQDHAALVDGAACTS